MTDSPGTSMVRAPGLLTRSLATLRAKGNSPAFVQGQAAGWASGWGLRPGKGKPSSRVTSPLNVYGGTDEAVVWVYACTTTRAQNLSAYPWWICRKGTERTPMPRPGYAETGDLYELLDEPNDEMSWFDWCETVSTELDLCGNSFWLKDRMNGLGQPLALEWLRPGTVKVVKDDRGKRKGYVYEPTDLPGARIPYELNEIIHFRNRNPLNRYYGMGIVEALIRSIDSELSQDAHVLAYFDQGAHLSGVLAIPETIGEDEFQRLKDQYDNEFRDSNRAFRVLVAEGATSYTPISSTPAALGVIDLRRMQKDQILSGFGVPEFLLGGIGQGGVYKMEEAQNILYRAMIPHARRVSQRLSMDVAATFSTSSSNARSRKPLMIHIDPRQSDPQSAKVERARKLVGTGASIDDQREEAGLDRLHWDGVTDQPLIPSGLVIVTEGVDNPNMPAGGQPPPPPQPQGVADPNNQPGGDGNSDTGDSGASGSEDSQTGDSGKTVEEPLVPALPDVGLAPMAHVASDLLKAKAPIMVKVDPLSDLVRKAYAAQRVRVLDALSQFGSTDGANLKSKPPKSKADLTASALFDSELERCELDALLAPTVKEGMVELSNMIAERAQDAVADIVDEGLRRGYSVAQIANGFPSEKYPGVIQAFDALIEARPQLLAEARAYMGPS